MNRFDGGFGYIELNNNLGVNNMTSHVATVKLRRDVGVQWSNSDIIDDSVEIPKFSNSITSPFEKSVGTRVGSIEQVRKQNMKIQIAPKDI